MPGWGAPLTSTTSSGAPESAVANEIWDYYAQAASPETADRLLTEVFVAVARVAAHPLHGRPRADLREDLRCVSVSPYIVFSRTGTDRIEVVRILHERRNLEGVLTESGL